MERLLLPVDVYSVAALPVDLLFNKTKLATATAFIWHSERYYLITNWHNVTGMDPFTGKHLADHAGEPDTIIVYFPMPVGATHRWSVHFWLRDDQGQPNWFVHPKHGRLIDVVAIPINIPMEALPTPINRMNSEPLDIQIGMDVYVLGYPFGIGKTGLPVWKRASIASEPSLIVDQQLYMFLDTASRRGMSGAPVIRRSWGAHSLEGQKGLVGGVATRFIGVYSGGVGGPDDNLQLGLMWPASFVEEIIQGNRRDIL